MMHFAVESTLETRGFLSRVRDGESTDWQMGSTAESDGVERLVEVFQGDAWSGDEASPAEMLDLYRVTCNARDCPPLQVTVDDIEAVRGKIHALDAQWQALAIGESMSLML